MTTTKTTAKKKPAGTDWVAEGLTERERFWLEKGYASVRLAAAQTHRSLPTIYRAIDKGELAVTMDGSFRFVDVNSLIAWVGESAAAQYGILPFKGPRS